MIEIAGVSLRHGSAPILRDITLTLPNGGVTALIGPNGAGKSTLLSLIARLLPLQQGDIRVDGLPVNRTPGPVLAKRLAILRQETGLASRLTVRDLVGFGRFPHSRGRLTPDDQAAISAALAAFDLTSLADRLLETLSGGQRQRAFVAMTYCQGTPYLLLDEPLNNLDMRHGRQMMQLLRQIADQDGRTIVIVLHDINYAAAYADRIIALKDGRVIADGPPADIVTSAGLEAIFGYPMAVETLHGRPVVLHHA